MLSDSLWAASTAFSWFGLIFFGFPLLLWGIATYGIKRCTNVRSTWIFGAAAVTGVASFYVALPLLPHQVSDSLAIAAAQAALGLGGCAGAAVCGWTGRALRENCQPPPAA